MVSLLRSCIREGYDIITAWPRDTETTTLKLQKKGRYFKPVSLSSLSSYSLSSVRENKRHYYDEVYSASDVFCDQTGEAESFHRIPDHVVDPKLSQLGYSPIAKGGVAMLQYNFLETR